MSPNHIKPCMLYIYRDKGAESISYIIVNRNLNKYTIPPSPIIVKCSCNPDTTQKNQVKLRLIQGTDCEDIVAVLGGWLACDLYS